jgi:Transposase DDE domain group 1
MARGAQELRCSCRPVWPVDRPCARPKATPWRRARHGFKREPDPRRACTCYHPLFVFNQFGDLERSALRAGNVHSADGWEDVLKPVVARYQGKVSRIYFRADAAFAMPEVYEFLKAERIQYAIRLPANQVLQSRIGYLLTRPVGTTSAPCAPVPCQFQPGRNLEQAAECYRQARVASRRTLSPRRLHRDEHEPPGRARRCFLQQARDVRAMDQGGQRRRSSGRDCRAERSPPTRCGSSFMRSPTTSAISCARWRRRSR